MKQLVDYEQAKQLYEAGIRFEISRFYNQAGSIIHSKYDYGDDNENGGLKFYKAPNIGELIEWICEETKDPDNGHYIPMEMWNIWNPALEPIDVLVELVLEINTIKEK